MGIFNSAILMFVLERQFFKPQTAIVQIKIIGWLKSLLYICIDVFIYIYKQCPLKIKLLLKVKMYEEYSDNGKQKKESELHCRAQLGLNWTWLRENDGHLKYLLWLTVDRTSCVYTVLLLIATTPSLWNKWRVQNQTRFTNTMYKFCFFQQFCFKVSSLYKRHTTYTNL